MKNLFYSLCLLIGFTSWASPVDLEPHSLNFNSITTTPDCELDALFKVNKVDLVDESIDIEDEPFDFDTAAYLPVGFNAKATYLSEISEIVLEEEDESFDFNTADYLPVGFSIYPLLEEIVDIEIIEEDEPFDFNTYDYLPSTFDAYVNFHQSEAGKYLNCLTNPSI